jgi:type I restriction enzyme R subunit
MLTLAKEMKVTVDDSAQYPDWSKRDDIKAKLKMDLILLLHRFGFPPVANDDVYKNVLEQAENFKKYSAKAKDMPIRGGARNNVVSYIKVGDKKLYIASRLEQEGKAHSLGILNVKLDIPYTENFAAMSLMNDVQALLNSGIKSPGTLDTVMTCMAHLEACLAPEQALAKEHGLELVFAIDKAKAGSIDLWIQAFLSSNSAVAISVSVAVMKFLADYPKYSDGFERLKSDLTKRWKKPDASTNKPEESAIVLDVSFRQAINEKKKGRLQ